ncbi:MAG: hypothetical protein MJZ10_14190, partial [Fibrobacter sp.]|nr:hypothetical protein [Fibrobacter sp.]
MSKVRQPVALLANFQKNAHRIFSYSKDFSAQPSYPEIAGIARKLDITDFTLCTFGEIYHFANIGKMIYLRIASRSSFSSGRTDLSFS